LLGRLTNTFPPPILISDFLLNQVMAVLRPLKVVISGSKINSIDVPHFPFDATRGSHTLGMSDVVYIDHSDFRLVDDPDYFGLAPGKMVYLRYASRILCESHEIGPDGQPTLLRCRSIPDDERPDEKPKGMIQFVPECCAVPIEARVYSPLFTVEEPGDEEWEEQLNPESEIVHNNAMVDASVFLWNPVPETSFQFERIGFFTVDKDSSAPTTSKPAALTSGQNTNSSTQAEALAAWSPSKLVFNMTVNLKDSKPKSVTTGGASRSRKEEQEKQLAEKMVSSHPTSRFTRSYSSLPLLSAKSTPGTNGNSTRPNVSQPTRAVLRV